MTCYYSGYKYSNGAVICINGGRYVCESGEWRNNGNCFNLSEENDETEVNKDETLTNEIDGVSIRGSGLNIKIINRSNEEKLVTLRVAGNTTRSGKFYVPSKNVGGTYDIQCLRDNEEGVIQITSVENPAFEGDIAAKEYLNLDISNNSDFPSITNVSGHHIYVALDFGYTSDKYPHPTSFLRYMFKPGKRIPLGNMEEHVKIFAWGTATIQNVILL